VARARLVGLASSTWPCFGGWFDPHHTGRGKQSKSFIGQARGKMPMIYGPNLVSVLFADSESFYKRLPCEVWDRERKAMTWPGGGPGVFHPPCATWGRLRHFSKGGENESDLALWAVGQVRCWGGVLEHPAGSELWKFAPSVLFRSYPSGPPVVPGLMM